MPLGTILFGLPQIIAHYNFFLKGSGSKILTRAHGSTVERLVCIEEAAGSNPVWSTCLIGFREVILVRGESRKSGVRIPSSPLDDYLLIYMKINLDSAVFYTNDIEKVSIFIVTLSVS